MSTLCSCIVVVNQINQNLQQIESSHQMADCTKRYVGGYMCSDREWESEMYVLAWVSIEVRKCCGTSLIEKL